MVLESLMAHLVDGVTVGFAWEDLGAAQLRGVDFLRAVEQARAAAVPEPTPGRVVSVVQAVFKARLGSQDAYLMQYDEHAGRYQPIGGKVDFGDADSADALRREMMEELRLKAIPSRYDCPLEPVLTGWFTTEISATYGVLTAYTVDFYAATSVRFFIDTDINTRWLTRDEIAAGRAADGRAITTIYQQALGFDLLDAIPPALTLTRR
jgi:8-oxo-dGTP pyrophosphatase MutT (NUDIX family)